MGSCSDDQREADHQENRQKSRHQEVGSGEENPQESEKAEGKRPFEECSKEGDDNEGKKPRMTAAEDNPDLLPPDIDILNALRDYLVEKKQSYPSTAENHVLIDFVRGRFGDDVRPKRMIERIETLRQSCNAASRIEGTGSSHNTSRTIVLSTELLTACLEVWGDFSGLSISDKPTQQIKNSSDDGDCEEDYDGDDKRNLIVPGNDEILQAIISYKEANQAYPNERGMSGFIKNWLYFDGDPRSIDQRIERLLQGYVTELVLRTPAGGDSTTVADTEETNGSSASSIGQENRDSNTGDGSQSNVAIANETSGNTTSSGDEISGQEANRASREDVDKNSSDVDDGDCEEGYDGDDERNLIVSEDSVTTEETNGSSASSIGQENRDPNTGDGSQSNVAIANESSGNTTSSGDEISGQEANRASREDVDKNPKGPGCQGCISPDR